MNNDTQIILDAINSKYGALTRQHLKEEFGELISKTLAELDKKNTPVYKTFTTGTQPYALSYFNRRHVYVFSSTTLTLTSSEYTVVVPSGVWVLLDLPESTRLNSTTIANILFLATDEILPLSIPSSLNTVVTNTVTATVTGSVAVYEDNYAYTHITTNATTVVKTGLGHLHNLTILNPGASWTIQLFDNTTNAAPVIAGPSAALAGNDNFFPFDIQFNTGLTIVTAGTTPGDIMVSWR